MGTREDIGIRIKTMRLSRRMTQADLAKAIGQSPSSITMYESGRRMPDFETMEALADVFNVPMASLVSADDGMTMEDQIRLEALHQNPKLGLLFDRSRKMSHEDVEFMLQMADRILKERDSD